MINIGVDRKQLNTATKRRTAESKTKELPSQQAQIVSLVPTHAEAERTTWLLETTLEQLRRNVLDVLDASIPNKQQHAAATRMVNAHFAASTGKKVTTAFPPVADTLVVI